MGKSNKPNKWFKAVKNAFRSPSKERPSSPDQQDTKADGDETLLSKQYDHSPVRHPQPTPHPLPSFEIVTHDEAEPERSRGQQVLPHPLPTPEAVDPAIVANHSEKAPENVIEEEENNASNGVEVQVVDKQQQQQDDDDSISEEEEAAAKIQQRFNEPLALKGLIRLQALLRGHQVRRQAATTLTTMEAIVRVQAVFRGRRVRVSKDGRAVRSRISKRRRLSSRAGLHVDASRGGLQHPEPQVIQGEREVFQQKRPTANLFTQQLKRSAPNRSPLVIDCNPGQPHWGWAWLELWSYAKPWENHVEVSNCSSKSKDFIEIIPSRKNSEYTTKEVDVNTLKVKYHEDYVPNPTPAKSRSSNPMSEKKEPVKSSSPMSEKKEPVKSSSPMSEKKEPVVKSSKEPVRSSSQKEHGRTPSEKESTKSANSMLEKRENAKSSAEKKEPTRLLEKKEPIRSARSFAEKKDFLRSSSSSLSEKRSESVRASLTSSFSEKKEPVRSPSSPFSEKRERLRSPSSPLSEKKELARSPSSPLSEKIEPDFGGVADWRAPVVFSPATTPTSPPNGHHVIPRPPPIEVPIPPAMEEDRSPIQKIFQSGMPDALVSPAREKSMPPSPAISESSLPIPPSPQASDTSLPVPETPPGLDSAGEDPSVTMEHLVLPEAHNGDHRGDTYGALNNGETHSSGCGSASNDEHHDAPSAKGSSSDVVNGHTSNDHQENGDSKSPNHVEKGGENGDSPIPSKRPTCRYMVPTESAKAKFRSSSNPKTRGPDTPDSPVRTTPKRYSIGGSPTVSKGTDSPKTAFGTRKSQSFQNRGTPSPKSATPKEKPRIMEPTGAESPARRNSLSGDKRWRT